MKMSLVPYRKRRRSGVIEIDVRRNTVKRRRGGGKGWLIPGIQAVSEGLSSVGGSGLRS